jgi:hypothetical protein
MRRQKRTSIWTVAVALLLVFGLVAGSGVGASYGACLDDSAVRAARRTLEARCRCAEGQSHKEYVECAERVINRRITRAKLPKGCRPNVLRCVRRSVCGRPNHVATCIVRDGETRCRILSADAAANPDPGTQICLRGQRSCCDADCSAGTCPVPARTCGDPGIEGAGFPQCGGSCESGFGCQALVISSAPGVADVSTCVCTRPDVSCGGASLQCSDDMFEVGVCPAGEACWALSGTECACLPLDIP